MTKICRWDTLRVVIANGKGPIRELLETAVAKRMCLHYANLTGANLACANLACANLACANLIGANLNGANLNGANLNGANLNGANLTGAHLIDAHLTDANLNGANLNGANLNGANLAGANLAGANLTWICEDLYAILANAPAEVPVLLSALRHGQIDGSIYEGICACLVGTIAKARHCKYTEMPGIVPNCARPAERWFFALRPSDTPANNPVAAITEIWLEEWLLSNPVGTGG